MLTTGQLVFAGLFIITFIIVMFFSYKKDEKMHLKNYKGVVWILIAFVLFILFLFFFKYFLKN